MSAATAVDELVDFDRYPIRDLSSGRARAAVDDARGQLAATGAAELGGFVHADGVRHLVADAELLAERAHRSGGVGTPYLEVPADGWPDGHPRRHLEPYALGAVGYDVIPLASPLRLLYDCDEVRVFVEAVLDRGPLYRYADPCGALNLAVMEGGDRLQWHFDQTDFVVSLAIQSSDAGGEFEVAPRLRRPDDERYDAVAEVLAGASDQVVTLPMTPGTLLVFEGRHSLHRVAPVVGTCPRLVGLLAYDVRPGTMSSELLRRVRYGRDRPFDTPPERWPPS